MYNYKNKDEMRDRSNMSNSIYDLTDGFFENLKYNKKSKLTDREIIDRISIALDAFEELFVSNTSNWNYEDPLVDQLTDYRTFLEYKLEMNE